MKTIHDTSHKIVTPTQWCPSQSQFPTRREINNLVTPQKCRACQKVSLISSNCSDCKQKVLHSMEKITSQRIMRWRQSIQEVNRLSRQKLVRRQATYFFKKKTIVKQKKVLGTALVLEGQHHGNFKFSSFGKKRVKQNLSKGRFFQTMRV